MAAAHTTSEPNKPQGTREWVIYVLRCPDTLRVRYVGWTVDLAGRMKVHRYRARKKERKTYCEKWILSLLRQGKEPMPEVVERSSGPWEEREQAWIKRFREAGEPLTNLTEGGEGCLGYRPTQETRKKLSRAHKGRRHSEEFKQRMREVMTGRTFTDEWRAKISRTKRQRRGTRGSHLSDEHRAKISTALTGLKRPFRKRGPTSEETRKKIKEALRRRYGDRVTPPPKGQAFGERIATAKITEETVRLIRALKTEGLMIVTIARRVGLHASQVGRILSGQAWGHVR